VGSRVMNVGKRVGGALYVHREALDLIGDEAEAVATAARLLPDLPWNVAKISRDGVSLLVYEDFDEAAFPALLKSARVDPATGAISITACLIRDGARRRSSLSWPVFRPRSARWRSSSRRGRRSWWQ